MTTTAHRQIAELLGRSVTVTPKPGATGLIRWTGEAGGRTVSLAGPIAGTLGNYAPGLDVVRVDTLTGAVYVAARNIDTVAPVDSSWEHREPETARAVTR